MKRKRKKCTIVVPQSLKWAFVCVRRMEEYDITCLLYILSAQFPFKKGGFR